MEAYKRFRSTEHLVQPWVRDTVVHVVHWDSPTQNMGECSHNDSILNLWLHLPYCLGVTLKGGLGCGYMSPTLKCTNCSKQLESGIFL